MGWLDGGVYVALTALCYDVSKLAGEAEAGPRLDLSAIGCVAHVAACRGPPRAWAVATGPGGVAGTGP